MNAKQHELQRSAVELVAQAESRGRGEGEPLAPPNLHAVPDQEKPEVDLPAELAQLRTELAEARAAILRWRNLAIRSLAALSLCAKHPQAQKQLGDGWVCFDCGMSGANPRPPDCPVCGSGGTTGAGTFDGVSAAHEALQLARGRERVRAPQESEVGQDHAPDGRRDVEIVRFCTMCRASVPPEVTKAKDCPSCHGRGQ